MRNDRERTFATGVGSIHFGPKWGRNDGSAESVRMNPNDLSSKSRRDASGRSTLLSLPPFLAAFGAVVAGFTFCVPAGKSTPTDAGTKPVVTTPIPTAAEVPQSPPLLGTFEDKFDRPDAGNPATIPAASTPPRMQVLSNPHVADAATRKLDAAVVDARAYAPAYNPSMLEAFRPLIPQSELGPNWIATNPLAWKIEQGRLCGKGARNKGVWLDRTLPVNARIEFDAMSFSNDGDLKAEVWGDGRSFATSISYTNATSYLTIFGGWKNTLHVLARIDEHGSDRKELALDPKSDDVRSRPVTKEQSYHFKIERADGKTVKWWVDGREIHTWADEAPLQGVGHDHFGFNNWEIRTCFDNVKVTALP